MGREVSYIISLIDKFSAIAAKINSSSETAKKSVAALGQAVTAADNAMSRLRPPPALAGMPGQFQRAATAARSYTSAVQSTAAAQQKADAAYAAYAARRVQAAQHRQRFEEDSKPGALASARAVGAGVVGGAAYGAAAGGLAGLNPFTGQAELERKLQQLRFKGELTAAQQKEMRNYIADAAVRLGVRQMDLLEGFTELVQAGAKYEQLVAKTDSGRTLFEKIALGAKASGDKVSNLAENILSIAAQARLPMRTTEEIAKAISDVTGVVAIAPALSPDSTAGHARGLYQIMGILAATKGIDGDPLKRLHEASALQSTLSKMGYKDALGGQALKTIIQRIQNPTPQGQQELRAAGFDVSKVLGINPEDLVNTERLKSQLPKGLGLDKALPGIGKVIAEKLAAGEHIYDIKDYVAGALEKSMGKKATKDQKAQTKAAVERFFRGSGFDVAALLEQTANLPAEAMKAIFGMWRAAQGAAMTGPQAAQFYKQLLDELPRRAAGFEGEAAAAVLDPNSYAYRLDSFIASWERLRNTLADAGALDAAAAGMEKLADLTAKISRHLGKNAVVGSDGMTWSERGWSMAREAGGNARRLLTGEDYVKGAAGLPFSPEGFQRWVKQFGGDVAGRPTAHPLGFGVGLAGAAATSHVNVTTKLDPIQVTAPPAITIKLYGPGVSGEGSVPLSVTAPRGSTTATSVPGTPVTK